MRRGGQTTIAQTIIDGGGDYVLALKGNQERLAADVAVLCAEAQAVECAGMEQAQQRSVDKDHGRVEVPQTWVITDRTHLRYRDPQERWAGPRGIAMVQAANHLPGRVAHETRYYSCSVAGSARAVHDAVRSHWGVENGLHWLLDMAFRAEECRERSGHAAHNFALLRPTALNLLHPERTLRCGVTAKRLRAGWDHRYLLKVLASI